MKNKNLIAKKLKLLKYSKDFDIQYLDVNDYYQLKEVVKENANKTMNKKFCALFAYNEGLGIFTCNHQSIVDWYHKLVGIEKITGKEALLLRLLQIRESIKHFIFGWNWYEYETIDSDGDKHTTVFEATSRKDAEETAKLFLQKDYKFVRKYRFQKNYRLEKLKEYLKNIINH